VSSYFAVPALATFVLCAGCVDPSYGDALDAGRDAGRDASRDASPPLDVSEPPAKIDIAPNNTTPNQLVSDAGQGEALWWSSLAEYYAVRIHFFGHDRLVGNAAWLSHEIIMLAHLTPNGDGDLDMELRRCRDHAYLDSDALPIVDHWQWVHPDRLAPEQHRLVMRDGKIRSEAAARKLGYQDEPSCTMAGTHQSFPDRPWLNDGKCDCSAQPLPVSANDCRVIDADHDDAPGLTVRHQSGHLEYVRALDDCQIVEGKIEGGRIRASYVENYDYLGLSCFGGCFHNDILVCPLELNDVLFEPISAQRTDGDQTWDCDGLLQQVDDGRIFPSVMLSFPTSCGV
jgi:hypothetical protein